MADPATAAGQPVDRTRASSHAQRLRHRSHNHPIRLKNTLAVDLNSQG